jgi:5-methylthioadenosine/S-adenosylhomocysteine deaminase
MMHQFIQMRQRAMNAASTSPATCDLLIRNAVVLTVDARDTVIDRGAIAIREGRILDVGPDAEVMARYVASRLIDAQGGVTHPGFIDGHIHVSQYTSRSVLSRMEGTSASMGDWKSRLTPDDEHASATLAALDYLRSGYTGFVDPGTIFEPDAVARVADELGIRIWLTDPYVADLAPALARQYPELANEAFLARWPGNTDEALRRMGSQLFRNQAPDSRVRAFVGLYGEGTDSSELFRAAVELGRKNGVQVQKHLGYSPAVYRKQEAELGRNMLEHLRDESSLCPHVTFIHMNVVRPADVHILVRHGVRVVWCPYGQLQMLGRGGAEGRMAELCRAGAFVGLGTDIPRVTHVGSLGTLAAACAVATGSLLSGREILRMRTVGTAATIGAEAQLGSIEVGKRADLVIREPHASEQLALDHAHEFGVIAGADSVATVIVDGRVVVENSHLLSADEGPIVARARQSARSLLTRVLGSA